MRGRVQLTGAGSGTVRSPSGNLDVVIESLEVDGLRPPSDVTAASQPGPAHLGRVRITAVAANSQATVTASADHFNVAATAVVGLTRPWPSTAIVRANDLDLQRLPLGLQARLTGHLRAVVNATGDLAQPARAQATASIEALAGSWDGQPFTLADRTELGYQQQRLSIKRLQLQAPDSSFVLSGELPVSRSAGDADLAIETRASLATAARFLPEDLKVTGNGMLALTGSIRGTLTSISPDLAVTLDNGVVSTPHAGPDVSEIHLRARVADGVAAVERLTGRWGSATIDAAGTFPLELLPPLPVGIERKGGSATIRASVRDLDPSAVPQAPAGLTGRVSVDIDATASAADLKTLEGVIGFPRLEITFNRLTLAQQEPSRIAIHAGAASLERVALSGSGGEARASGTVGLVGERRVDLKMDGSLNIAALSGLMKGIRTDGTATWNLAAIGTVTSPELHGTFDLAEATVASDALNIAAENVGAHINLAGPRIELRTLSGEVNGGTLDGSGVMTLGGGTITDLDLRVSAKDFAYDAPLDLRSLSDATIHVSRRGDEFVVDGQVTINEAGLTTDINFDDGLFADIRAPRTRDLTEPREALLERVRFAININTATPVMIDNNLARAGIDANLRIVGTPYEPGLTGRLTVDEGGQITLNARRYAVERGIITFVDDRRIVPSVDLVLNTKASNYDVRITVAGTTSQTETTWTSEPPLPEPDIMALVVTGRTVDEMRGEESEVARVQALTYLTGRVGGKFGRGLERATGLSEVRIEPVLIANETDPTARLTVGQNITNQMKLVYSTNLADMGRRV
jgi:autotransporter translocation and assembly factor TamB